MRHYTTPEQTAKLIELGLLPKSIIKISDVGKKWLELCGFSIGELMDILGSVSGFEVNRFGNDWEVGDELRAFQSEELIDALYEMVIKLKEEGVI